MTNIHSSKLIWITPDAEKLIAYCARVSSKNQDNPKIKGLLKYCMKHGHWSVFEMASMCVEITTTRAISAQILRHRSFSFQEFSQRYADPSETKLPSLAQSVSEADYRLQDYKNRQNSLAIKNPEKLYEVDLLAAKATSLARRQVALYNEMIEAGIAKECARNVLPLSQPTKMYMSGTIRSFIHYCKVRCSEETQLEHRLVANSVLNTLKQELPTIGELI